MSSFATLACSALLLGSAASAAVLQRSLPASFQTPLPPSKDPFYTAPEDFANALPGTILRMRAAPGNLTAVTKNSSEAYNILYRTTDSRYNASWAVTTLFAPLTSANAPASKQLLSYQIPYDSANVDSSPSYALYASPESDVSTALGRGWFVNVPDYEGPLASFTAGVQAGHATLDSVRAALQAASGLGLADDARYAMWGYSGGALASEWAAELQQQYASDLDFSGVALGGLTPNVTSVLLAVQGTLEVGLVPAGIIGSTSQYPEVEQMLEQRLKTTGMYNATTFNSAKNLSLSQAIQKFAGQNIGDYFEGGLAFLDDPTFKHIAITDGQMGYHGVPQMPVFAYKAIKDEVSPINDTDTLIERYCGVDANIQYVRNTIGGHSAEAINGLPAALSFLRSILEGSYNHTGCSVQNVSVNISSIPF